MADYTLTTGGDTITGTDDADRFSGPAGGFDVLKGGGGTDTFDIGQAIAGTIDGGSGTDIVKATNLGAVTFTGVEILDTPKIVATLSQLLSFTTITNSAVAGGQIQIRLSGLDASTLVDLSTRVSPSFGVDLKVSAAHAVQVIGTSSADILYASGHGDTLLGGDGMDTIYAGVAETVTVDGGRGNDVIVLGPALPSTSIINGGDGDDILFGNVVGPFPGNVNLGSGVLQSVEILGATSATGTISQLNSFKSFAPQNGYQGLYLVGQGGTFEIGDRAARDVRFVIDATDTTSGVNVVGSGDSGGSSGSYDDTLIGSQFDDTLAGGDGADTFQSTRDSAQSGGGNDRFEGGNGDDSFQINNLTGFTTALGGDGDDVFRLRSGRGSIDGGDGEDTIASVDIRNFDLTNVEILRPDLVVHMLTSQYDDFRQIDYGGRGLKLFLSGEGCTVDLSSKLYSEIGNGPSVGLTDEGLTSAIDVTGTSGGDALNGSAFDDTLRGGTGNDILDGAAGHNTIYGEDGNDTINLLLGTADTAFGGTGNDLFQVLGGQAVVIDGGDGLDTVQANGAVDLASASFTNIEVLRADALHATLAQIAASTIAIEGNLILTGPGGALALTGHTTEGVGIGVDAAALTSALNLTATDSADTLRGSAFADTLAGGLGDDVYRDIEGDTILEAGGEGTDRIETGGSTRIGDGVEDLTLTGNAASFGSGNALANVMRGNDAGNVLAGNDGNDTLFGNGGNDTLIGGEGADSLFGGLGDDVYRDVEFDRVFEDVNAGTDRIETSGNIKLDVNIENLTMTGTEGSYGAGNALANVLRGNVGNNVLAGDAGNDLIFGNGGSDTLVGGAGTDTLYGGLGDDIYRDVEGDQVRENAGEGIDGIETSASTKLTTNIENLTLTGTAASYGAGNELDNLLRGNAAANVLAGDAGNDTLVGAGGDDTLVGGLGTDTLVGSVGDDVYRDVEGDTIIEVAGQGIDRIETSGNTKLGANIENLTLTGTAASYGYGNVLANVIRGNGAANVLAGDDGNDTLLGGGGNDLLVGSAGRDALYGEAGSDTVRVLNVSESTGPGRDLLAGFNFNEDRIDLAFTPTGIAAPAVGALSEASFDHDLGLALDAAHLGAHQAVLFDPNGGDLDTAGTQFLVIDANGVAGYQAGEDLVFQLLNHDGTLTLDDFV